MGKENLTPDTVLNSVGKTTYEADENTAYYNSTSTEGATDYATAVAKQQNPNGITENVNGVETTREATAADAKFNSGSGVAAAVGKDLDGSAIDYSWNKAASKLAENSYQQKVVEEKQGLLTNRQELEKNAQQYQTQADMQKYSDNQAADKVGWTGGYVLDQQRQQDYMKASIQAQLYGAMELQKYGYDTAMSAARLAYDANLLQTAQEYYNEAVQNSLNEAQITGTYFSAEVRDMLSQMKVAEQKEKDATLSADERTKAANIRKTIENWFSVNNISPAGIKTVASYESQASLEFQWSQDLWKRYNTILEASKEDASASNKFYKLDENGKVVYDGTTTEIGNWDTMTASQKLEYALSSDQAADQLYSYLDSTVRDAVANYKQTKYNKEKDTYNISAKDLADVINTAIENTTKDLKEEAGKVTDKDKKAKAEEVLNIFGTDYAEKLLRESFPKATLAELEKEDAQGEIDYSGQEKTVSENKEAGEAYVENLLKANPKIKLNESAEVLSTTAEEIKFGKYTGTNEKDDTQSIWVNCLQRAAAAGMVPEGTMVSMNIGARGDTNDKYVYSNGYWFKLEASDVDFRQAGGIAIGGSLDNVVEGLKKITGKDDIVSEYKKWLSNNKSNT